MAQSGFSPDEFMSIFTAAPPKTNTTNQTQTNWKTNKNPQKSSQPYTKKPRVAQPNPFDGFNLEYLNGLLDSHKKEKEISSTPLSSSLETNDPTFVQDLLHSHTHVQQIAQKITDIFANHPEWQDLFSRVDVPKVQIRPSIDKIHEFSDDGDMFVVFKKGTEFIELRVEVKQRKLNFKSVDSFPYKDINVDVCHTFDESRTSIKKKPIFGYVITNEQSTSILCIPSDTFSEWRKSNDFDRFKNRYRNFYYAPKSCACELTDFCQKMIESISK
jgi:hypothetical protein